jgi:hypothetical protein
LEPGLFTGEVFIRGETMRTACLLIFTTLLGIVPIARAQRVGHTWVVLSTGELDARIQRQLGELAAQDQALIRFFRSPREAARHRLRPGDLSIELHDEKSVEAFLKALKREAGNSPVEPTAELAGEGYILEAFYPRASVPNRIHLTAATSAGFHHGLRRIPDLLVIWPSNLSTGLVPRAQAVRVEKNNTAVVIADFPSFPERGVVEGFYGVPWSHEDRLAMLRFQGQHGMNVYYYAPKDDPYHRKLWRDPYPPEQMKRLGELVDTARRNFVDLCFAISPGLSMTYSSEQDFATLTSKLASVSKLEVSCFALFLDDVPPDLQSPQDQAQFRTLAQAHTYLINKLYKHLKAQSANNRLTVTPTTYTNEWGNRDYIKELGAGVDPDVSMVWTGPEVASPAITVAQAKEWGEFQHRKPLVWDNFPVNDGRPWRLHLGPLRGRDPNLPVAIRGLFSNPMNQARASMIPLASVSDYLWNSLAYDPGKSRMRAVTSQYGKDAPQLLASFLKVYGDYWWDENIFTPLFSERRYPVDIARIEAQIAQLTSALGPLGNQKRLERLLPELATFPRKTQERLPKVTADPAFRKLPDGKLQWREDYDALSAYRLKEAPNLDGDFSKWQGGPLYVLNNALQISQGSHLWKGPGQFSARAALGWDENYLYLGVDVTDPELYQPFFGRGIENGNAFTLTLETAFRKNFELTRPQSDEYSLFFSPGDFAGVKPSVFSDEDYLPPRPQPHDYNQEIKTAWKKTSAGYSGDIAIPVSYFDGGKFSNGYEIGLSFGAQKVFPPKKAGEEVDLERIKFTSKTDRVFHASVENPSSLQRLVLIDLRKP